MWDDKLRHIRILTLVTFLLVLATGILSISSVQKVNKNIFWTLHTKDVLQLSDELYASILETESNLRGYSLSSDQSFITDYTAGKLLSLRLIDSLEILTSDNTDQRSTIHSLRVNIKERIMLLDSILALVKVHQTELNPGVSDRVIRGRAISRKIKEQLIAINNQEYLLLQERNKGLYRNLHFLPAIILFTTLTGLGAGALLIYSLFQYNRQKKEADKEIANYQQQLKDQILRLNASNKELEQFAYVASHDLQEPLRKISAFSDLLKEQYKDNLTGDGELYIERIMNASARMRDLITDLLNYSRVSRKTTTEEINLNAIIDKVKEDMEIQIKEKRAVINAQTLPVVKGNGSEFRQLFQNLISNSLKFSRLDTPPSISIEAKEPSREELSRITNNVKNARYVSIYFTDNGIGFDEEYAEKIFIIFQRLHGRDAYEGTGIGLAICKKIAEKYGGTIYAGSTAGQGARFIIILPLTEN